MGKGFIAGGGTDGDYLLTIAYDRTKIDAEIAELESKIPGLEDEVTAAQAVVDEKESERDTARGEVDAAIAALNAYAGTDPAAFSALQQAVRVATTAFIRAQAALDAAAVTLTAITARLVEAQTRLAELEAIPSNPTQQAWCVDFTEDLTGTVGTIEIPGEGNRFVLIRPGYSDSATYSESRDGQLSFRKGQSPEQAYFNAAILPGWQKFKPLHRAGTLTDVDYDNDRGNVTLDTALSSAQSLDVNQASTLAGVSIRYMNCNASAFEVGDHVLVEFGSQNWDSPTIIGFASGPKRCGFTLEYTANEYLILSGETTQEVKQGEDGTPVSVSGSATSVFYYAFYRWSDGSTDNPRTDTNVQSDISVNAQSAEFPTQLTLVAGTSYQAREFDIDCGTRSGNVSTFVGEYCCDCDFAPWEAAETTITGTLLGFNETGWTASTGTTFDLGGPVSTVTYDGEGRASGGSGQWVAGSGSNWNLHQVSVTREYIELEGGSTRYANGTYSFTTLSADSLFAALSNVPAVITVTNNTNGATCDYAFSHYTGDFHRIYQPIG